MAEDDIAEAIRLSLASAQDEEKKRKQAADEERAIQVALKASVEESPVHPPLAGSLISISLPDGKENRQLKDELQFYKTKLKLLEDASKVDVERSQLRSFFNLLNPNASGDSIGIPELKSLLETVSGQAVSLDEVTTAFKALQPANAEIVTFDEFYKWWHSAGFAAPDPSLRPLHRLAVPSNRNLFLRLGRRLLYNEGGLFPSPLNDDRSKVSVKIATAPHFESKCGGRLYYVSDAKLAETRRKDMKIPASENDGIIFSVSLSFVDGVDEFGLGELAGSLKDLLSLAKDELNYTNYQVNLARENGQKRFRIVLCFSNDEDEILKFKEFIRNLNVKSLNCNIDLSQSFSPAQDDKKAIEGRVQLDAEVNTKLVDWIINAAVEDRDKKRPKYLPPRNPNQTEETDLLNLFRLLQCLKVDISLDTLTQKWRHSFEDKKGPSRVVLGWREITNVLLRALAPAAENENIPDLVWDTYKNALSTFREVSNVTIQYQHQMLVADLRDIAVFQLFPTVEALRALPPSSSEKPTKAPRYGTPPQQQLPQVSKYQTLKKGPWDS